MVESSSKNSITKVYCVKCDIIFNSRKTFEKHLVTHLLTNKCETCPIDVVISKFVNIFKKKFSHNME
ncbi:MAG: hypothetical protein COW26_07650 [Nitrosopumilales archaeon CG15_BIG_FIL_POST_REV_8_21_14_020_33_23]|nr:MAG: hypothetical protein COV65_07625 [Nitrosopumilales archaeon CG11_big_fil_rev_8_21_14_0_20_33_24]PIW34363.1 MAG: hypothetical protein COW26_07650 [Nitrosopumilales archaeon CG15_BIG_FIL_POST_REV_8_21_14_020_33_23]PIY90633.1 MAG: hypothetical protein COY74_00310 [Nitrosopumilales archaeon CG_4_10_14_0_8_um_filter_34_8]PJB98028.1 MAG: hypothetical protein CO079_04290 [Nitrosopumilales archaeon CG_4_9_14_0_8_um_filter_34_10]